MNGKKKRRVKKKKIAQVNDGLAPPIADLYIQDERLILELPQKEKLSTDI